MKIIRFVDHAGNIRLGTPTDNTFTTATALDGNLFTGLTPTKELLSRACATLTENEQRMREGLLVSATQIEVNEDLYAIYGKVGPSQWLEVARLICEERVPPRDVIARIDTSPIEVEETLKDLLRRGVVTLKRL